MRHVTHVALITLLAATPVARAGDDASVTVPDRAGRDALYAWLDEVGYPDGVGLRAVRLQSSGGPEIAFVTGQEGEAFTLFVLSGHTATVTPDEAPLVGREPPRMTELELPRAIEERLHDLAREPEDADFHWGSAYELPERTRLALLARHAWRTHDAPLEERLLVAAATQPGVMERAEERAGCALADLVRKDVELFERVQTWDRYASGDSLEGRRDVLLRFARLFPDSDFAAPATEQAAVLVEMETTADDVPTDDELAALQGDALARGLVLRLRDQGAIFEAMGGASAHMNGHGDGPLDRLIAMGEAALPALLDAMDDPTLTRVVSHGRVGVRPVVHTVGNLARDGVQAITGQWFQSADEARTWLARRDEQGEAALLAPQVFQGTWVDSNAARRLVAADPAVAARTLGELLAREMTDALRMQVIRELGVAQTPDVLPLLRAEASTERSFAVRQAAAQTLAAHQPAAAREVVLELWRTDAGLVPLTYPASAAASDRYWERESAWTLLLDQLIDLQAWDEIAAALPAKTLTTRATMLRSLANAAPDPLGEPAVARLLLGGLRDDEDAPYGLGASGLGNCPDARVADLVGAELATRDAAWRPFPANGVREDRDALLGEMRNALRAALGQEPEPEPQRPVRTVAGDDVLQPLAAAFVTEDLAALDRAEDAVAAAGLPALPGLRQLLDDLPADVSGRSALERGIRRLATTVGRVILRDGVDEETGAALGGFAGSPLDVDALVAALRGLLEGGHALSLYVHRPDDDSGCTIAVAPPRETQGYRLEMNGTYSQTSHRQLDDGAWRAVEQELRQGTGSPAGSGWAIGISLR